MSRVVTAEYKTFSKDIKDRICKARDDVLKEELDFIPSASFRTGINYGIKYRMGIDRKK